MKKRFCIKDGKKSKTSEHRLYRYLPLDHAQRWNRKAAFDGCLENLEKMFAFQLMP